MPPAQSEVREPARRTTSRRTHASSSPAAPAPKPETLAVNPSRTQLALLWTFLVGPFLALALAVTLAQVAGVGPTWLDAGLAVLFYAIAGHGVTVGFHRYFTHRSFTAKRPLRIALAVAGSMAVEGSVTSWVADHRRHHAHSDGPGDPHSPWRFGPGGWNLTKGLWWAHMGWLFADEETNRERFAPDLLADRGVTRVNALFPLWIVISILAPALLGGLITWSWSGALTAVLWAGLVRIFVLHHITWSTNSVCHVVGSRPFESRDRATNVWPLAVLSMGESWHNLHHADPTCARHGVDRGQVDSSARLIRWMERFGWVTGVRWPDAARLSQRRVSAPRLGSTPDAAWGTSSPLSPGKNDQAVAVRYSPLSAAAGCRGTANPGPLPPDGRGRRVEAAR